MKRFKLLTCGALLACSLVMAVPAGATSGNPGAVISNPAPTAPSAPSTTLPGPGNSSQPGTVGSSPGSSNTPSTTSVESSKEDRVQFERALENARETTDLGDLSPFTSYLYVEKGFFGMQDPFPKIANALVQGIFFLTKIIYVLATIVLGAVFNANVYSQLDTVVQFSGGVYEAFRDTSLTYMLMIVAFMATVSFVRKGRVPMSLFKFVGVMLLGMFFYSKSSFAVPGTNLTYNSDYNLSKLVKSIDVVSSDLTTDLLVGFDELDADSNFSDEGGQGLDRVKGKLFEQLVYQPFLHLNYKEVDQVTDDQVVDLFETKGDLQEVKKHGTDFPATKPTLSYTAIGHKILVALASLFKALVIGLSVVVLGMISLVFKFLALLMVVASVGIFFVAMIPGFGHILENAGKSLIQFAFIGGLGLVFVRGFLYLVTLIDQVVSSMATSYYWVAILQGIVLYLIYRFRFLFLGIFSSGVLRAKELGDKVQSDLSSVQDHLTRGGNFSELFSNYRPILDRSQFNQESSVPDDLGIYEPSPSLPNTFSRATANLTKRGAERAVEAYDSLRYGPGETVEKAFAQSERERLKQRVSDGYEGVKDKVVAVATLEKPRAVLHDLAGDEYAPAQQSRQERQQRSLERQERQQAEANLKNDYLEQTSAESFDRASYKDYRKSLFDQENPDLVSKHDVKPSKVNAIADWLFAPDKELPSSLVDEKSSVESDFVLPQKSIVEELWNENY